MARVRGNWQFVRVLLCAALLACAGNAQASGQQPGITAPGASTSSPRVTMPLTAGLTIVTTVTGEPQGEFESIKQVVEVTPQTVRYTYTGDRRPGAANDRLSLQRTQQRADLRQARDINTHFSVRQPELVKDATTFSCSTDVLRELKTKGAVALGHIVGEGTADVRYPVLLHRVEADDVPYPVIVKGKATALPAVHAKSSPGDVNQAEFYFLDDPENPILLFWESRIRGGKPFGSRVLKASVPHSLEQALRDQRRVEVYGIYFDFNSDTIRAESEPVLRDIAEIMTKNPSWRLNVEGHTDNVGGDTFNADLSKRRAAAVKRALVERYHIGQDRLDTAGYGASRPKASNDTAPGRAQNRRVELVRL